MDTRIPPEIQACLQNYQERLDRELPGRVMALYLVGSIALDDYHPGQSDIDFVSVLACQAAAEDFEILQAIHKNIRQQYPSLLLEGMYIQPCDIGCLESPTDLILNYHDGKLNWSNRIEMSSVSWWILKHCGIAVFGQDAQTLPITIDMEHLLRTQRENMNSYWASWTRDIGRILLLYSDWGVQWTVLGVLRQFFTLKERQITSKTKAGYYALGCLPERWHRIIRESIALREVTSLSYYRNRIKRAIEAYLFLIFIISFNHL
jgi:hypothetical protein